MIFYSIKYEFILGFVDFTLLKATVARSAFAC
jgi:hypothetical protein